MENGVSHRYLSQTSRRESPETSLRLPPLDLQPSVPSTVTRRGVKLECIKSVPSPWCLVRSASICACTTVIKDDWKETPYTPEDGAPGVNPRREDQVDGSVDEKEEEWRDVSYESGGVFPSYFPSLHGRCTVENEREKRRIWKAKEYWERVDFG